MYILRSSASLLSQKIVNYKLEDIKNDFVTLKKFSKKEYKIPKNFQVLINY